MDEITPRSESPGDPTGSSAFELENLVMEGVLARNPDWERTLAPKKIFYLRGYSWFQNNVGDLTLITGSEEQKELIETMHQIVRGREQWNAQNVIGNTFSFREQVTKALGNQRTSQRLEKSLGTLGVCEAYLLKKQNASETSVTVAEFYKRMRIQAACFYISNFTDEVLSQMRDVEPRLLSLIEGDTNQLRHDVFYEMALTTNDKGRRSRKLVTKKLAQSVFDGIRALQEKHDRLAAFDIGTVSCAFDSSITKQRASDSENIKF